VISDDKFTTGEQAAVTNGTRKVTFDTPSDFADWLDRIGGAVNLVAWQWCKP
jgi:hypothetical protein